MLTGHHYYLKKALQNIFRCLILISFEVRRVITFNGRSTTPKSNCNYCGIVIAIPQNGIEQLSKGFKCLAVEFRKGSGTTRDKFMKFETAIRAQ